MNRDRRRMLALAASALAGPAFIKQAAAAEGAARVQAAVDRFARIPATASCLVAVDHPTTPWRAAHDPASRLFVGSAVKTFILAQYLREVEAGRLTEDQQMKVDDAVRSASSPVFLKLAGTTQARSVLEAMIAHSDNTATDIALAAVGPAQVRALIDEAGLKQTQNPGIDPPAVLVHRRCARRRRHRLGRHRALSRRHHPARRVRRSTTSRPWRAPPRSWCAGIKQALRGAFFKKPDTLVEFKRIQAMADAIARSVPPDTPAYGKGGSIDWDGFYCMASPAR